MTLETAMKIHADPEDLVIGESGKWEIVIGLEVHAQVLSKAKLFSGAATEFGSEANCQVSFVDAAFPGMLPVLNRFCVEQAARTGLGIKGTVNPISVFDRKNYFYADLPQGYQISQFTQPIVSGGEIILDLPEGKSKTIGVTRLHLEQDAGKSMHDQHATRTFVDLNRSGVALMEIVSEPEMRSPEEAAAYLRKLRAILRFLGTCDGNMDEGSMRCDANVSVRRPGDEFGTRCEIKNVNSIRFVSQAIAYEARRQIEVIEGGGKIHQETRLWDSVRGETRSMRSKEDAHDYRYFPDPDLLPLELQPDWIDSLRQSLPELPDARCQRYVRDYGLTVYDARVLSAELDFAIFYETALGITAATANSPNVKPKRDAKLVANWVTSELFAVLNRDGLSINQSPISPVAIGELVDLISDATISGKIAKELFQAVIDSGESPLALVESRGLRQVSDSSAIAAAIDKIIAANSEKVAEYRSGKDKLFGFFVGQVMKDTGGKANPTMVNDLLKQKLAG